MDEVSEKRGTMVYDLRTWKAEGSKDSEVRLGNFGKVEEQKVASHVVLLWLGVPASPGRARVGPTGKNLPK